VDRTVTGGSQFQWDRVSAHSSAEPNCQQHIAWPRRITEGRKSGTLPQYQHTTALLFTFHFPTSFDISNRRPPTANARVRSQANARGFCGDYETRFPPNISTYPLFSRLCHPVNVPHPVHLSPTLQGCW